MNIIRQIKGTTGIEGNTLTEARIEEVIVRNEAQREERTREEIEVVNTEKALHFIQENVDRLRSGIITEELVCQLHEMLTQGCDYPNNTPGRYRQHAVEVPDYRPPDHDAVPDLMHRFVEYINSREVVEGYGPLIRAIIAHFYLISIHPFGDGNGRTSRAVEAFVLYLGGYNTRGFYSLSNYFYKNRRRYVEVLQEARFKHNGNLTEFAAFCLNGFVEELQGVQDEILDFVRRVVFRDIYMRDLTAKRINAREWSILEHLTFHEVEGIGADDFRSRSHYLSAGLYDQKSPRTLARDLRDLIERELVSVKNGRLVANLAILEQFT